MVFSKIWGLGLDLLLKSQIPFLLKSQEIVVEKGENETGKARFFVPTESGKINSICNGYADSVPDVNEHANAYSFEK